MSNGFDTSDPSNKSERIALGGEGAPGPVFAPWEQGAMSSILNRLKAVEGATFQKEGGATDRPPPPDPSPCDFGLAESRTCPPRSTGAKSPRSDIAVWLYRLLPGFIVLLVMLLLWRPWGGQSPVGKPLSRGSRPNLAVSRSQSHAENAGVVHPSAGAQASSGESHLLQAADFGGRDGGQSDESGRPDISKSGTGDMRKSPAVGSNDRQTPASAEPVADSRSAAAPAPNDAPVKAFLRSLSVTGVYQDAAGTIAFINGRSLKEGDELEQVQIVEIRSGRITFAYQGKRYVLPLQ